MFHDRRRIRPELRPLGPARGTGRRPEVDSWAIRSGSCHLILGWSRAPPMSVVPFPNARRSGAVPRPTPPVPLDAAGLVAELLAGHASARAELFDRFAPHVRRVLARVLGHDSELADLL